MKKGDLSSSVFFLIIGSSSVTDEFCKHSAAVVTCGFIASVIRKEHSLASLNDSRK